MQYAMQYTEQKKARDCMFGWHGDPTEARMSEENEYANILEHRLFRSRYSYGISTA